MVQTKQNTFETRADRKVRLANKFMERAARIEDAVQPDHVQLVSVENTLTEALLHGNGHEVRTLNHILDRRQPEVDAAFLRAAHMRRQAREFMIGAQVDMVLGKVSHVLGTLRLRR